MARYCTCGAQIEARNKSGLCRPCVAREVAGHAAGGRHRKTAPPEFFEHAAARSNVWLRRHFGWALGTIAGWRHLHGIPSPGPGAAAPANKKAPPADLAELAPTMTLTELTHHYGLAHDTLRRMMGELGVAPKRYVQSKGGQRAADRVLQLRVIDKRDDSTSGRAAQYLQRWGEVIRCDGDGRPDPRGSFWRVYGRVRTDAEVIERAEAKGWQRDAWRALAA